ncbi:MAG: DEAD/DEAH box helicase, partial [Acidimicrobiia bacterium]|nr:DEAD/DEAH box helicase [Acidimicrobiia bacterium]
RTPLWLQRRRAADLLSVARQFGSFPIILETYREILQDDFDVPSLRDVLADIRARRIRVAEISTESPTPFASSLLFAFVAAYLYEGDTPLAERRAAALTLDREMLRELLGEGELRDLLDADQLATLELELQRLTEERQANGADGIADLLQFLGPLGADDIELRTHDTDVMAALDELIATRRVIAVTMKGELRYAAVEDAGRLRDALGVQPPSGVAHAFLEPVDDPLGDVIGRFARTHGPFTTEAVAGSLGLPVGVVTTALRRLDEQRRVVQGAFRPGGSELEWIDSDVLRTLKRRSLAALRSEIEPVTGDALGRFLPVWQGVSDDPPTGRGPLLEVVRRLQGAELPASVLLNDVLPSRHADADAMLDQLMIEGELVWAGRGTLGARDGKLALYFRDQLPLLWVPPVGDPPDDELHRAIRSHLEGRGASFFKAIYLAAGGGDVEAVLDALWDLVWAGEVTNDTFAPVRAFGRARKSKSSGRPTVSARFPQHAAGRWSLVTELLDEVIEPPSGTQQATAWTHQLLDRHGIVTRQSVAAEGLPGGFTSVYPVLQHLEETGRARRGYFIERLGGAQFALPGAVDRVRSVPEHSITVLASTDPANPYGAALDWPAIDGGRIGRIAGTYVILADGHLVGYLDKRKLRTFKLDPDNYTMVAAAIARLGERSRTLRIESIDGEPPAQTALGRVLGESGFLPALRGLSYRS